MVTWFFKSDLRLKVGGWTSYKKEEIEKIEAAFQHGKKKIKLNDTWSIHLKDMYQYRNSQTDRQRHVKREDVSQEKEIDHDESGIDIEKKHEVHPLVSKKFSDGTNALLTKLMETSKENEKTKAEYQTAIRCLEDTHMEELLKLETEVKKLREDHNLQTQQDQMTSNMHEKHLQELNEVKKKAECAELAKVAIEEKVTKLKEEHSKAIAKVEQKHKEKIEMISKKHVEEISKASKELEVKYKERENTFAEKEKELCTIRKQLKKKIEELHKLNKQYQDLMEDRDELSKRNSELMKRQSIVSVSLAKVQKQLERSESTKLSQQLIKDIQTQSQTLRLCADDEASLTQVYEATNASLTQVYTPEEEFETEEISTQNIEENQTLLTMDSNITLAPGHIPKKRKSSTIFNTQENEETTLKIENNDSQIATLELNQEDEYEGYENNSEETDEDPEMRDNKKRKT